MIKKNSLLVDLLEYNVAVTLGLSISGDFSTTDERFTCLLIAALKVFSVFMWRGDFMDNVRGFPNRQTES